MTKPDTILRFYKPTTENFEALEAPYIYLFSAKQWKNASEMQFEVDTSDPIALKQFVIEEVERAFSFAKDSDEYKEYFGYRYELLKRHGRTIMLTSAQEKDHLIELSLKELTTLKIKANKKGLIRNNFFSKTGISCFTADQNTLEDRLHWGAFANSGEGFCVEYDWAMLEEYFRNSNAGIRGDYVKYYEKDKPKIILQSGFSQTVMENYCDIIFSLRQMMKDEKEFRLAKVYEQEMLCKDDRRKQSIPAGVIKTIAFGPKMSTGHQGQLAKIINRKFPGALLVRIDDSDGFYKKFAFQI